MDRKLFLTVILLCTILSRVACQTNCDAGIIIDGVCFSLVFTNSTWSMAADYCRANNGMIASITSARLQQKLVDDLIKTKYSHKIIKSVWVGGYESVNTFQDKVWSWVSDGSKVGPQGCYTDVTTDRDLPVMPDTVIRSPEACISKCINTSPGYQFAGVQNGGLCYCGNGQFGKHGTNGGCNTQCSTSSAITMWCGGTSINHVYNVTGSYAQWGYLQPNNQNNYQTCAVLDGALNPYKFADEECHKSFGYICEINGVSTASCNGADATGFYYAGSQKCYYISQNNVNSRLNWFMAQEKCKALGGYLVKISGTMTSSTVHRELQTALSSWSTAANTKLWIGLRKGEGWKWRTNEPFAYTNWFTGEPNSATENCIMLNMSRSWMWSDELCSSYSYFICQGGSITTTTTTTVSTTTATTTVTGTTNVTSATGTPQSGAQTSGGLTNEEIETFKTMLVLMVVLLVMGIIALLILILLCVYCCKKKKTKVTDSKDYTVHSIYAASETGRTASTTDYSSKFIDINDQTDFFTGRGYHYRY